MRACGFRWFWWQTNVVGWTCDNLWPRASACVCRRKARHDGHHECSCGEQYG